MKETSLLMTQENILATLEDRKTQTRRTRGLETINMDADAWCIAGHTGSEWGFGNLHCEEDVIVKCPYGVGDRLYIKETHYLFGEWLKCGRTTKGNLAWEFKEIREFSGTVRYSDNPPIPELIQPNSYRKVGWYKRSPLFMPKKFARHWREITKIRAERVQDITEEDAKAEGANPFLVDKLKGGTRYKMIKTYHHEFYPLIDHADKEEEVVFDCPNMGFARLRHTTWQEKQEPFFRIPIKEVFEYVGALKPDYRNGFRILWDSINANKYPWANNDWVWPISYRRTA